MARPHQRRPLVSMAVPSYNHARFILECLNSIIDQDYSDIELIVIDDGSSDESPALISGMERRCRERFSRFEMRCRENRGIAATLNEAIEWAKGDYFAAIASDDALLPHKTSLLLSQFLGEEGVVGVFGGVREVDEFGRLLVERRPKARRYSFEEILLKDSEIYAPTQMLELEALRAAGPIPTGLYIEDWFLWLALTETGMRLKVVPDVVVQYRRHGLNSSRNIARMHEGRMRILARYSEHPSYGLAMSNAHMLVAIELASGSRRAALRHVVESARFNPGVLATPRCARLLTRLAAPRSLLRLLRKGRSLSALLDY